MLRIIVIQYGYAAPNMCAHCLWVRIVQAYTACDLPDLELS